MEKNRLIIVEGPQGTGKTTLTNYLRDNIPSSNLYRLAGSKDKTIEGKKISQKMYYALQEYLKKMESIPMDLIFDRTFFTEQVYASLGYKEYEYNDLFETFTSMLDNLNYDIYLFLLYLEDTELYKERLDRKDHHKYQAFSIESSVKQQIEYLRIGELIEKRTKIKVYPIAMDNFDEAYEGIKRTLKIK